MAIPRNLANLANQLDTSGNPPKVQVGDSSVVVTDTGSNGTIAFTTDNSERMRVTSGGLLLVNQTTDQAGCLIDASRTTDALFSASRFVATTGSASFYFNKSRGASVGTNTIVQADDSLGVVYWRGANGTGYTEGAYIAGQVDGTPGASNDMPGRLVFATTADGSGSPTERMRITQAGRVGIGTTTPSAPLDVNGAAVINAIGIARNSFSGNGNFGTKTLTITGLGDNGVMVNVALQVVAGEASIAASYYMGGLASQTNGQKTIITLGATASGCTLGAATKVAGGFSLSITLSVGLGHVLSIQAIGSGAEGLTTTFA